MVDTNSTLEEIENKCLFSIASPEQSKAKYTNELMETLLQQKGESMKETIHSDNEAIKMFTKSWKTPNTSQESAMHNLSGHNLWEKEQSKNKGTLTQDFQDFLNNDMSKIDDLERLSLDEAEKENLELLTDELIQVFNLDNIDKRNDLQKEELML